MIQIVLISFLKSLNLHPSTKSILFEFEEFLCFVCIFEDLQLLYP
jgi:hypothetical protein